MSHTVNNQGDFIFVYKYEKGTPVRLFAALGTPSLMNKLYYSMAYFASANGCSVWHFVKFNQILGLYLNKYIGFLVRSALFSKRFSLFFVLGMIILKF